MADALLRPRGSERGRHVARRRGWRPIVALAAFSIAPVVLMGSAVVVPEGVARDQGESGRNHRGTVDLFDENVAHSIAVTMDPGEYDAMIADYQQSLVKTWHEATVVIDGVALRRVGVRLKGNSTLIGLRAGQPGASPFLARLGALSADEPQKIPWLIRLDKYLPDQRYQHVDELALRSAGGFGSDSTLLTEHLANKLTRATDQPYLRSSIGSVSFNGSPDGYTLFMEHPGKAWTDRMFPGARGALYKAEVGARFRYVGDDPASYANVFSQSTQKKHFDLRPTIGFLQFVEQSTDAEFEAGLADRLDIDRFVSYLVLQNVLVDSDSLAGSGNNYYLYYDAGRDRITVTAWDQNLAFARLPFVNARYRTYYEDGFGIPSALSQIPGLEELVPGDGIGEPNLLVTRFFASAKLRARYDRTYQQVFDELFESGRAEEMLDRMAAIVEREAVSRGLVAPDRFQADIERTRQFIADRIAYLRTVPPVLPS